MIHAGNAAFSGFPKTRYRALDSLRGFAALTVALGHFGTFKGFSNKYYLAVDFFLVLSGFVLAHSYFSESSLSLGAFTWRRWARMYPLHLATLLVMLGLNAATREPFEAAHALPHLLFVQNLGFGPSELVLNIPSWTISIEFWINVGIYSLVLLLGGGLRRPTLVSICVIAAVCYAGTLLLIGHLNTHIYNYKGIVNSGLVRCAASFCVGVLVYAGFIRWRPGRYAALAEPVLFGLFLSSMVWPSPPSRADFYAPVLYIAVVWVFAAERGPLARSIARLGVLGDISFSIYMVHYPLLSIAKRVMPTLAATWFNSVLFAAAVLLFSTASYRWFELPIYRRLILRSTPRTPASRVT